jgi:acyl-CoA synthetase (NDP forming)
VYDAVLRQFGVYRAHTLEEFFDVGCAAAIAPLPRGDSVGLVTVSGGAGVLLADAAAKRGLDVAEPPPAVQSSMKAMVPIAGTTNPFDITGYVVNDQQLFGKTMRLVIGGAAYSSIVAYQGALYRTREAIEPHLPTWRALRESYPERLLTVSGFMSPECHRVFEEMGIPAFREPTHAVRAVSALRQFAAAFERVEDEPPSIPSLDPHSLRELDEAAGLNLLAEAGIPIVPHRFVTSRQEAAAAALELGYPVAVKGVADGLLHKTDVGAVRLGVRDGDSLDEACVDIRRALQRHAPDKAFRGYLVQRMISAGLETIIGVVRDPVFGPMVMFGLGGIFAEVLDDVSFRAAPFGIGEAHRMLRELRSSRVLDGYRGTPPVDRDAIATALVRLSALVSSNPGILTIEANPFIVFPAGQGAAAVDAVVQLDRQS